MWLCSYDYVNMQFIHCTTFHAHCASKDFSRHITYCIIWKLEILVNLFTRRGCVVSSHHIKIHIDKNWQHIFLLSLYTFQAGYIVKLSCTINVLSNWDLGFLFARYSTCIDSTTAPTCFVLISDPDFRSLSYALYSLNHWPHPDPMAQNNFPSCGEASNL